VSAVIYLEGGGDSKELHSRCREGFRRLLQRFGFDGRMPRLVACGGRDSAFDDFRAAHVSRSADFIALWIDSEDPLTDLERTWAHLKARDGWEQPEGVTDHQVFFMTTCMETWLVTDRDALKAHYGTRLRETALPPLTDMEQRHRHAIQDSLIRATEHCSNAYAKGKRSFELLAVVTPEALEQHLPSFVRVRRILNENL
jgi:hypothetical protein